jgi:hypothetical protein
MKKNCLYSAVYLKALFCAALLAGFAAPAYCQDSGAALLLQMTPEQGGSLNISTGVHVYEKDAEVTLTATPRPGYQFVCWQGSVVDATSSSTLVFLDSPKIIVAVFERSKFDLVDLEEGPQGSAGSGRLIRSGDDISAGLESATGGRRPQSFHWPRPQINEDVPVPQEGDNNDVPVPVPEPATITFVLGGLLVLARRRKREIRVH